jgi:hypothetical protein
MNTRIATATRLGFREQARRPLLLVLLVAVPFFFITKAIASTRPLPRRIGLPGGHEVLTTMRDIHGALMAAIAVAFLAGLCGAFIVRSARQADLRLVVAGFRPVEALLPRMLILSAATFVVLGVSLAVTALSFTPHSWLIFAAGTLLVGLTYACIGALAGALLGQLGATYLVFFLGMLGLGILQNPMFGTGTPTGAAVIFPDYGAVRVIVDGSFSSSFSAWAQLALALGWLGVLVAATTLVLRHMLRPSST